MSWTAERARVASLTRSRTPDDPVLINARRSLKAERLADYIRRTVDAAPPLTPSQRDKLALLLRGAPPGAASARTTGGTKCAEGSPPGAPEQSATGGWTSAEMVAQPCSEAGAA